MNVGVKEFVPGGGGGGLQLSSSSGGLGAAAALAPAFVPAAARPQPQTQLAPAAAPFVPRAAEGAGQGAVEAPAVSFLRGAVRGGVPVPQGEPEHHSALPQEEELFSGEATYPPQRRRAPPQPLAVLGPDGPVYLPRASLLRGGDAAAAAIGPVGPTFSALPPPRAAPATSGRAPHASRFSGDALRSELARQRLLCAAQPLPGSEEAERVPQLLHRFHSLLPLEEALEEEAPSAALGGLRSACFKALSLDSGLPFLLRRLCPHAAPPSPQAVAAVGELVARWAPLAGHPGICALRGGFAADCPVWGPLPCLLVAHDYQPGALTLAAMHCGGEGAAARPEQLWQVAVQAAAALQAVHGAGLCARAAALAPSKVLLCAGGRLRLAAAGLPDLLAGEGLGAPPPRGEQLARLQRADLHALGRLLLALGCGPGLGGASLGALQRQGCPPRLLQLVAGLVEGAPALRDAQGLAGALGEASLGALSASLAAQDALVAEAARDAEAGALLRSLAKLCFVLERPGAAGEEAWAETGDRYLLLLFRDWLFHQPRPDGAPRLDWGLVYEALGKLDVGAPERILLLSRDEATMLVASFADIKRCAEAAYAQLEEQQARAEAAQRALAFGGDGH